MVAVVCRSRVRGSMSGLEEGFRGELVRLGYAPKSVEYQVWLMSRVSQWLDAEGIAVPALDETVIDRFIAGFRAAGQARGRSMRSFWPMLVWLRREGVVGPPVAEPRGALDDLIDRYQRWMLDRGLALRTIGRYAVTARRFLVWRSSSEPSVVAGLSGADVTEFLLFEAGRGLATGSLKGRVAGAPFAAAVLPCRGPHPVIAGRCCSSRRRMARHGPAGDAGR